MNLKTVSAYQCDRCGRLRPADIPCDDWFLVHVEQINGEMDDYLLCSYSCISIFFRPQRTARKPVKRTRKKT